jgi:hypothetical protein
MVMSSSMRPAAPVPARRGVDLVAHTIAITAYLFARRQRVQDQDGNIAISLGADLQDALFYVFGNYVFGNSIVLCTPSDASCTTT